MLIKKRSTIAVILNVICPGVGYLYLGDPIRKPMAVFMITVYGSFIGYLLWTLIKQLLWPDPYFLGVYKDDPQMTGFLFAMYIFMSLDTYYLSRRQEAAKKI